MPQPNCHVELMVIEGIQQQSFTQKLKVSKSNQIISKENPFISSSINFLEEKSCLY